MWARRSTSTPATWSGAASLRARSTPTGASSRCSRARTSGVTLTSSTPTTAAARSTALDTRRGQAPGTRANSVTVYATFFAWLDEDGRIEHNPMQRIRRPRLPLPEELDVPTVTATDVMRLLEAWQTTGELLCIALLAYLWPRRRALAGLRWRDVDFERGTVRSREKGRKTI